MRCYAVINLFSFFNYMKININATLKKAKEDVIVMSEPCDCGAQIRHNNGGNYHELVSIAFENDQWYVKFDTTCELTPKPEWDLKEEQEIRAILEGCLRDDYAFIL